MQATNYISVTYQYLHNQPLYIRSLIKYFTRPTQALHLYYAMVSEFSGFAITHVSSGIIPTPRTHKVGCFVPLCNLA